MSFLDFAGVATIIPFLAVLGNPEMVETNRWLSLVYKGLNFTDPVTFLFFLGMVFFVFLVFSTAFKVLTEWAMYRFSFMRTHSLSCRLLQGYLGRPMPGF